MDTEPEKVFTKDELEVIRHENDPSHGDTNKALKIVLGYVQRNKDCIITGGFAIDKAMREHHQQLYADDVLPDYDCLTPNYIRHSYGVAKLLFDAGLPKVSVIRAMHTSTLRVRVNYVVVFDVTYIPVNIAAAIPTLESDNVRFVHPHFQMIDQALALSQPYMGAPREALFHRWAKDLKRGEMLSKLFPLPSFEELPLETATVLNKEVTGCCLTGFAALAVWNQLAINEGFKSPSEMTYIETPSGIEFKIPEGYISMYTTTDVRKRFAKGGQFFPYNPLTDKLPAKYRNGKYELFDASTILIGSYTPWKVANIHLANIQSVFIYFATYGLFYQPELFPFATLCREIVDWAAAKYADSEDTVFLKFLPTVETYGVRNISETYLLSRAELVASIKGKEWVSETPLPLQVEGDIPASFLEYDPTAHFHFDGLKCDRLPLKIPAEL